MDQAFLGLMSVMQSPCKLDRDIEQSLLYCLIRSAVQRLILDPALQAPVFHPFRKDSRHSSDFADIKTGDNIRVQSQIDPVLTLADEVFLAPLAALCEVLRQRTLHRKVHIPSVVMHFPDTSHAALYRVRDHIVNSRNGNSFCDGLI